ncbi:MAG: VWA domain-containing protein [Acidobacteriota bacterium]|nr:VWA domain-containing protein [Acidobacteriota bacterium]
MKYKYRKYEPDEFEGIDLADLVSQLSDLLLSSGFQNPWDPDDDSAQTMQALHDAILDALLNGGVLDQEAMQRLFGNPLDGDASDADQAAAEQTIEKLVQKLMEGLQQNGYITQAPRPGQLSGPGDQPRDQSDLRFEITDKSIDFLGYRALRDLLGSMGRGMTGRHDTRELATGIDAGGAAKPYEFGDTMNLDASATLLNAVNRGKSTGKNIDVDYEDLMVTQGEYQSTCATVLMLDCSHSMILYGEDRFTPAKRVAMALATLTRTQYPGDSLNVVLFHDSAEEIPIGHLARARVGPHYTNTREGLRLARRILERQRTDMRQIIMITDGKPSALTQPDGRIYRNAFGLDPYVVAQTFAEVAACRRAGIMINTFMLARDYDLVAFVRRVAHICRGKAYFTTPHTLGKYVLMDYMDRKTRTVH